MTTTTTSTTAGAGHRGEIRYKKERVDKTYYLLLFPVVLLFTFFITYPALVGMFFSVTDYVGYGEWKFTGITNYRAIFNDPRILNAYYFTLFFSVVTVIVVNAVALGLALALNAKIKFKTALRGVFFIPMVVSGIVIAYVFSFLFSTSLPTIAQKSASARSRRAS